MKAIRSLLLACTLCCLTIMAGCGESKPSRDITLLKPLSGPDTQTHGGVVVSVSAPASEAGRDILMQGGNAVDAAVATAFALAVTFPEAGNIGGGGFMVIQPPDGRKPLLIDYRETAPAAATTDMLQGAGRTQYRLVGTPGTVRGLALAHQRFGKLPWASLLEPAIKLAANGFEVNAALASSLNSALARPTEESAEMRRVLGKPDASRWSAGDRLVQPELAQTLRLIAQNGPDAFYTGPIAADLVATVKAGGGIITTADLAAYKSNTREPIRGTFRGYEIIGPPPPSSGGICLIEMLNILECHDLRPKGRWSAETLHLMIEAMRYSFLDRARYLGDPDFVSIPDFLTSKTYAAKIQNKIDLAHAGTSNPADATPPHEEGEQTTHFSILDADGMAVSNTYTLEQSYGSHIMVRGRGFLLNNEMGDFNSQPGITTTTGQIGTPANIIAPGKRMLSSMTPTIITRDGKVILVTGSPGSRTIINTVACVVLNRLEFGMSPRECIDAPRISQTWLPDTVALEPALARDHAEAIAALRAMGQPIAPGNTTQGDANSIFVDENGLRYGIADQRHQGTAASYNFADPAPRH